MEKNTMTSQAHSVDEDFVASRKAIVFDKELLTIRRKSDNANLPEEFYNFTANDWSVVQASNQARALKNKPFKTRTQAERERKERAQKMPPVRIRIIFPDDFVMQCVFKATESISEIYKFTQACIKKDLDFYLFTAPPRNVLDKKSSVCLYDAALVPSAKIYFSLKDSASSVEGGSILNLSMFENCMVKSAEVVQKHGREEDKGAQQVAEKEDEQVTGKGKPSESSSANEKGKGAGKSTPKWFKLGKK